MKRNIEFRFWDKGQDRMLYDYHCGHHNIKLNDIFKDEQLIFQQWTGLTDKHNKKMYEGDILKHPNWIYTYKIEFGARLIYRSTDSEGYFHYDVNNNFLLRCIQTDKMIDFHFDENEINKETLQLSKVEVIGNIYETPELNTVIK